jgi:hypothetical protein
MRWTVTCFLASLHAVLCIRVHVQAKRIERDRLSKRGFVGSCVGRE